MPVGIRWSGVYNHQRKEVHFIVQTGTSQPIEIIAGAEAFLSDIQFLLKNEGLAAFLKVIRDRKDLPADHDFGPDGGRANFNQEWENRMEDNDGKGN